MERPYSFPHTHALSTSLHSTPLPSHHSLQTNNSAYGLFCHPKAASHHSHATDYGYLKPHRLPHPCRLTPPTRLRRSLAQSQRWRRAGGKRLSRKLLLPRVLSYGLLLGRHDKTLRDAKSEDCNDLVKPPPYNDAWHTPAGPWATAPAKGLLSLMRDRPGGFAQARTRVYKRPARNAACLARCLILSEPSLTTP